VIISHQINDLKINCSAGSVLDKKKTENGEYCQNKN
jgi:hypothetical protein